MSHPKVRYTHGGILAALIDLAGDYAIAARLGRGVPTIDMRIDYHRTALPGPLVARATIIKIGSTVATAEAQVFDEGGKLVASGRGAYLTLSRLMRKGERHEHRTRPPPMGGSRSRSRLGAASRR